MRQIWKARFGVFLVETVVASASHRLDASNVTTIMAVHNNTLVRLTTWQGELLANMTLRELRQIALFQGFHNSDAEKVA